MTSPRLIQKLVYCSCGLQQMFCHLVVDPVTPTVPLAQLIHHHPVSNVVHVMTLMGDESVRAVDQKLPEKIYVQVVCPDDCDCHEDRWDD